MKFENLHEDALNAMTTWATQGCGLEELTAKLNLFLEAEKRSFEGNAELGSKLYYLERWSNCCLSMAMLLFKGMKSDECMRLFPVVKDIAFKGNKELADSIVGMVKEVDFDK